MHGVWCLSSVEYPLWRSDDFSKCLGRKRKRQEISNSEKYLKVASKALSGSILLEITFLCRCLPIVEINMNDMVFCLKKMWEKKSEALLTGTKSFLRILSQENHLYSQWFLIGGYGWISDFPRSSPSVAFLKYISMAESKPKRRWIFWDLLEKHSSWWDKILKYFRADKSSYSGSIDWLIVRAHSRSACSIDWLIVRAYSTSACSIDWLIVRSHSRSRKSFDTCSPVVDFSSLSASSNWPTF